MTNKPLCIYHHNCADGFGAAWVVNKFFSGNVDFHPGIYGEAPPVCNGRDVYIVDFSYPLHVTIAIMQSAKSVTILDHHKSAAEIETLIKAGEVKGIFDIAHSGAMLAWKWFFPDKEAPLLLRHIEDRDLWKFEMPWTREIQAALFSYPYDFMVWDSLIESTEKNAVFLAGEGKTIERKHHKDIAELLEVTRREMNIGGHVVWVANLPYTMASDAAHTLCKTPMIDPRDGVGLLNPPAFAATYYDGAQGRFFSLRSVGDFDVSEIAKKYGGGGHKNAAGFKQPVGWEGE
jgi:uncharacterized protein